MELAVNKITFINITIEFEFSFAGFLAVDEVAGVFDLVVLPLLGTFAVVHVIEPFTIIHRSILINEDTFSASLSFLPLSMINVTIFVRNSTLSMEESFLGHSLIERSIREFDLAQAFPSRLVLVSFPLTFVLSALADI